MNYHFRKPEYIALLFNLFVKCIFETISSECTWLISKQMKTENYRNELCKYLMFSIVFYRTIYDDANLLRVYEDALNEDLLSNVMRDTFWARHDRILLENDIQPDSSRQMFNWYLIAEHGVKKEMLKHNDQYNTDNNTADDFACLISTIAFRLAGVPDNIIEYNTMIAQSACKDVHLSYETVKAYLVRELRE